MFDCRVWLPLLLATTGLVLVACSSTATQSTSTRPTLTTSTTVARALAEPEDTTAFGNGETDADLSSTTTADEFATDTEPGSDEASTSPPAEVESTTTSTSIAPEVAESPQVTALLDELMPFVERERGLTFKSRPVVHVLDDDEFSAAFRKLVVDAAADEQELWDDFTDIYQLTGILRDSTTLEETWLSFGDAGVLGYHENRTGELTLRAGEITAFSKVVLVHELTHALDHQHFDLDRPEYDDDPSEIGWTFSALVEGSATVIEDRYWASLSTTELDEALTARRSAGGSSFDQTASFLELQFGRYRDGAEFAEALWAQGQAAVDAAFVNPPTTSEEIVEIDFGLPTVRPALATPADGEIFEQGVWGQAAWYALFLDHLTAATALEATSGWGSDWFVAWRQGSRSCVRVHVEADSEADLDQFFEAATIWAAAVGGEVFSPNAETVRVTVCS